MPVYDEKFIKPKVKEFNGAVNTNFWGDKEPKKVFIRRKYSLCKYWFCLRNGKKIIHKFI